MRELGGFRPVQVFLPIMQARERQYFGGPATSRRTKLKIYIPPTIQAGLP
jgi:hypothetical protein